MYVTETFARYATAFANQPLPAEVAHHAERALVDWYASYYPGLAMPSVKILADVLSDDFDRGDSRIVGGRQASPRAAALFQGTAAHAAEVDDSFRDAMYHPGAATIAAALSMAHTCRASGADLLRAVVLGYEISTRIGVVLGRPHYKFWHNTGTVGVFGAAASAASLLRLDASAYAHALAIAATFSAGLQQAFRL
ncbi:MAG: MmgE/PrpD family protein, partial [Hydrogenophaga sp.]|nr:MmgE/PrpD family protein [Hydrogenophaga sp.]